MCSLSTSSGPYLVPLALIHFLPGLLTGGQFVVVTGEVFKKKHEHGQAMRTAEQNTVALAGKTDNMIHGPLYRIWHVSYMTV